MKVLVVGCGSIGKRHIANIVSLGAHEVTALDSDPAAAREAAKRFGVAVSTSLTAALDHRPDCVFITTPTASHLPPAIAAARAGCHLFIEKPLSHSMDGVEELIDEVVRRELVAMVGCNMRFHPNLAFMKGFLDEGRLGKIYSIYAEAGSYLPHWRPGTDYRLNYGAHREMGGGVLLDSIHELDYVRWLIGDVGEIRCVAGKVSSLEIETEDLALILLRFSSGALGALHLDYFQRPYCRTLKVIGEGGTLSWEMTRESVHLYDNRLETWQEIHRVPARFAVNQLYVDEIRAFFEAVRSRSVPMSEIKDAARVLELTLRCKESADLDRMSLSPAR